MSSKEEFAFDETRGDWRVTGSYDGEENIVFYHKGEIFRKVTVPGYKIWNITAHLDEILEDFDKGIAEATSTGLGGVYPDDRGAVSAAVYIKDDQLVIHFAEELRWLSMGKGEAEKFVAVLQDKVRQMK